MLDASNYITVQGWMATDLGLKGNELLTYALIYGFSQDNESVFCGTCSYITDWLGISRQTAINILKSLTEKGYITKIEKNVNGVTLCDYKSILQGVKKFDRGVKKFDTNNKIYNPPLNNTNTRLLLFSPPRGYEYLSSVLEKWLQYKKEKKQSYKSDSSILTLCKRIEKLSGGNVDIAMQIIEQSIANNWSGIFPLKENFPSASSIPQIDKAELSKFVEKWNNMADFLKIKGEFVNANKVLPINETAVEKILPEAKKNLLCVIDSIKNADQEPVIPVPELSDDIWGWGLKVVAMRLLRSQYLRGQTINAPLFRFDVQFFCTNIKRLADPYDSIYLER